MPRVQTPITTRMVKEIHRLNQEGKSDREIAEILGISQSCVWKRRKTMGLPPMGKARLYTVWNAKTDELIVCGTADECAKFMGYATRNNFHGMVHRMTHGMGKKYHVEISKGVDYDDDL